MRNPSDRGDPTRRALCAGDRVALVAPAGPIPIDKVEQAVAHLEAWELRVTVGAHIGDRHPQLDYLAGTDTDRIADFRRAWLDPDIAAVFCVRGGYGALRIVDHLDWPTPDAVPKLLVGSSDITALHAVLGRRTGVVSLFAPMVATDAFLTNEPARDHLRHMLFQPDQVTELHGPNAETFVGGRAAGRLTGGNLSLLAAGLGAPTATPPSAGAIALLEDVGEEPYRIDRYLTQLLRAGWFDRVAGIALGSWHDCGEPADVRAVLRDRLEPIGLPTVHELGFGHCPAALTVPLGATAELDADAAVLRLPAAAYSSAYRTGS